jgi:REP element-mobilizing transposase RayT
MILGFHSIIGMYGFWLPNDPRGSGSDYVANYELYRYGPATKTTSRRSVAAVPHDHAARLAAKETLDWPAVKLTAKQRSLIVAGFAKACTQSAYALHACAVMPDHVHLVIGAHPREIRLIVGHLKGQATLALKSSGIWPNAERPVWGDHGWNVYLDSLSDVRRAIRYVEQNPIKEGFPKQDWEVVTPYRAK